MKKVTMVTVLSALVVGMFANCARKDSTNPNRGAADMSSACYFMQTNGSLGQVAPVANGTVPCAFNYSSVQGFTGLNGQGGSYSAMTYNYGGTYPVCMSGSQTLVYSPSKGLGCVNNNQLSMSGQLVVYDLNRVTLSFTTVSVPTPYFQGNQYNQYGNQYGQYGNQYNQYGYPNSGYGQQYMPNTPPSGATGTAGMQVLRVCDSAGETCPNGQNCRSPFGPQTAPPIGVCYF